MGIPTEHDLAIGEIEDVAASIRTTLTTLRYSGGGERAIAALRDLLQDYVTRVMKAARSFNP